MLEKTKIPESAKWYLNKEGTELSNKITVEPPLSPPSLLSQTRSAVIWNTRKVTRSKHHTRNSRHRIKTLPTQYDIVLCNHVWLGFLCDNPGQPSETYFHPREAHTPLAHDTDEAMSASSWVAQDADDAMSESSWTALAEGEGKRLVEH